MATSTALYLVPVRPAATAVFIPLVTDGTETGPPSRALEARRAKPLTTRDYTVDDRRGDAVLLRKPGVARAATVDLPVPQGGGVSELLTIAQEYVETSTDERPRSRSPRTVRSPSRRAPRDSSSSRPTRPSRAPRPPWRARVSRCASRSTRTWRSSCRPRTAAPGGWSGSPRSS
ncbi:hypothetical protein NKH77_28680 [Streptomyces sp. M19]